MDNTKTLTQWFEKVRSSTFHKAQEIGHMVVDIKDGLAMVHSRFKLKSAQYYRATELPFILAKQTWDICYAKKLMAIPTGQVTFHYL